ncbi:MAG: hypothetical protein AB8C13_05810 [Phycisphaerales bacterium]
MPDSKRLHRALTASALGALALLAPSANAQSAKWAYVLDHELNTTTIESVSANSTTGITGTDQSGLPVQIAFDDTIGLWIDDDAFIPNGISSDAYSKAMYAELTDGQRVLINLTNSQDPDLITAIRLDCESPVRIPLDRIRTLVRAKSSRDHSPSLELFDADLQDDAIRLLNNDLFTGFITSIGTSVEIETINSANQTTTLSYPVDQVHSIRVQNPSVHTPGTYILTSVRERLRVHDFEYSRQRELSVTLDDSLHDQASSQKLEAKLVGVDRISSEWHLLDLASQVPPTITPTGNRAWAPEPEFSSKRWLGTIRTNARIPSPVSIRWELPSGSKRLAMSINPWEQEWTNNEFAVRIITTTGSIQTLWSKEFDSTEAPRESIVLDIPNDASALELYIDPALNGPIQDQFFVSFPIILIDGSPELQ